MTHCQHSTTVGTYLQTNSVTNHRLTARVLVAKFTCTAEMRLFDKNINLYGGTSIQP